MKTSKNPGFGIFILEIFEKSPGLVRFFRNSLSPGKIPTFFLVGWDIKKPTQLIPIN